MTKIHKQYDGRDYVPDSLKYDDKISREDLLNALNRYKAKPSNIEIKITILMALIIITLFIFFVR